MIIDRFEGEFAVVECDNQQMLKIKRSLIQKDAKEGDVIVRRGENYFVDKETTEKRRREVLEKLKRIGL